MTDTAIGQDWLNEPQQARSKETMNRFVLAAEQLLRDKPFDEITIGEIVTGAERTVGSFYARFDDKWALLRTVVHRYLAQVRDFLDDMLDHDEWSQQPISDMVRVTCNAVVGLYRAHGHIFRAGLAFAATDCEARSAMVEHNAWITARIAAAVMAHPDSEPDRFVDVLLAIEAVGAVLITRLLYDDTWHDGTADWDVASVHIQRLFKGVSGIG